MGLFANCDKRLFALYTINFFINASNSIIAPFFPDIAKEKGLSDGVIGGIFSIYQIGGFFCALLFGKMMRFWGRKSIFTIGLLIQSLSIFSFGVIIHVKLKELFIVFSFLSRLLQGVGNAAYSSIAYAYLPLLYPESVDQKISYMEIFTGLGLMLGPLLGTALYALGGYQVPFYSLAGFFLLVLPFSLKLLPNDKDIQTVQEEKKHPISILKMFSSRKILLTSLVLIFGYSGVSYILPVFSTHLHTFNVGPLMVGVIFTIATITYTLTMPFIAIFPKRVDRKVWLSIGLLIISLGFYMLGPEPLSPFPNKLWVVCLGLAVLGVGAAMLMVPSMPELIKQGLEIYDDKEAVGDMCSGIFNASFTISGFFGPNTAGILNDHFGFARGCSIFAFSQEIYLIIFIIFCDGIKAFKTLCVSEEKKDVEDIENKIDEPLIKEKQNIDERETLAGSFIENEEKNENSKEINLEKNEENQERQQLIEEKDDENGANNDYINIEN